jgi:hypothetical protein
MKQQPAIEGTKKEFTIFKQGMTHEPVTILSKEGERFDRDAKIDFYLYLGYAVCNMDGTKIVK